jgi:hypothetical protein
MLSFCRVRVPAVDDPGGGDRNHYYTSFSGGGGEGTPCSTPDPRAAVSDRILSVLVVSV